MSDLISRGALMDCFEKEYKQSSYPYFHIDEITDEIIHAPAVDAVPVVHGRWEEWWPGISVIMTGEEMLYRCSVCTAKYADIAGYNYCPNCGADMRGDESEK